MAAHRAEGQASVSDLPLDRSIHAQICPCRSSISCCGLQVVLEEKQGDTLHQVPLIIQGLTSNGYLKAQDEQGEQYELHPDGNR